MTALLGNTAKSSTPPLENLRRAERYAALATARKWIFGQFNKAPRKESYPGDWMRTHDCRFVRKQAFVDVHVLEGTAHYSGLVTCGSVWACPVCAVAIQERRRSELQHLVDWAPSQGLRPVMVTLTFPHTGFDSLADLIQRQRDAFKRFRTGSPFSKFKKRIGYSGLVRSLEVTHGANGWHPHTHELWLIDQNANFDSSALSRLWERACIAVGLLDESDPLKLHGFRVHAVDFQDSVTCADYLAKQDSSRSWGIADEVAKAKSKKGKLSGVHPHEFLIRRDKGDNSRFFEYIAAMKGSRQLYWSPGLKDRCQLPDVDDFAAVQDSDDWDSVVGSIDADEWDFIRGNGLIARVLDLVESSSLQDVRRFLAASGFVRPDVPPAFDDLRDPWYILPSGVS